MKVNRRVQQGKGKREWKEADILVANSAFSQPDTLGSNPQSHAHKSQLYLTETTTSVEFFVSVETLHLAFRLDSNSHFNHSLNQLS